MASQKAPTADDEDTIRDFVDAKDPITMDRYLQDGKISSVNVVDGYTSLICGSYDNIPDNVMNSLTSIPPANINHQDYDGYSALMIPGIAAEQGRHILVKILINFGVDKSLKTVSDRLWGRQVFEDGQ